jgi:hypothetical protein
MNKPLTSIARLERYLDWWDPSMRGELTYSEFFELADSYGHFTADIQTAWENHQNAKKIYNQE